MTRFESKDRLQGWIASCLEDSSDPEALEFIYQFICDRERTPFPVRSNNHKIATIQRIGSAFILPAEIDKSFVQEICGFYLRKKSRQDSPRYSVQPS